jgi:transcriptional regulator with XRE-family HTH domain
MNLVLRKFSYRVKPILKEKLKFAERLRFLRDQKGLSNLELGKSVGLSHVSIGNFLDGQLPKSEYLAALAEFFGVSTDWLLGRDAEMTPPALHENTPEYLLDDALAELDELKEKVQALERALRRLKEQRDRAALEATRRAKETGRKSES